MTHQNQPSFKQFLKPKFWPTWLGLGFLSLVAFLPFYARYKIGSAIGLISFYLAKERRYITQINLGLCFPDITKTEQALQNLTKQCFIENGVGLIETITGWVRKPENFEHMLTLIGKEHMDKALAKGKGVLLLGAHYSTLDFSSNLLSMHYQFGVTYRAHKNPLFDAFMRRGRVKINNGVFDRKDIRNAFKHLRKGNILWYAPDQDYGPAHSVYAPLFGQTAATITAASRFADFNKSPTLLVRHHRHGKSAQYDIELIPLPESFPSNDIEDAKTINTLLEKAISVYPEQYLWMHKRFKTQPEGKPASPYIDIKTANKKISAKRYEKLLAIASNYSPSQKVNAAKINTTKEPAIIILENGLQMKEFKGTINRLFPMRHIATRIDYYGKQLRIKGIDSVTCDVIFQVPEKKLTAVSYYPVKGTALNEIAPEDFPIEALTKLFTQLHQQGCKLETVKAAELIFLENGRIHINNPEDLIILPTSLSYLDRFDNLLILLSSLKIKKVAMVKFIELYLEHSQTKDNEEFSKMLLRLPDLALVKATWIQV